MKKLNVTLKSALKLNKGLVGYVYPQNEESYYLNSGIAEKLYCIECLDGYFYTTDKDLASLQKEVKHAKIHYTNNDILCMMEQKAFDLMMKKGGWEELRG